MASVYQAKTTITLAANVTWTIMVPFAKIKYRLVLHFRV